MIEYHNALRYILTNGKARDDRTGEGTIGVFGMNLRFDLSMGFPAVTTKKLAWKSVVSELLWFLEGSTSERRLAEILYNDNRDNLKTKTTIWTANANDYKNKHPELETGDLGPVYGKQWRSWTTPNGNEIDQIQKVIDGIINDPFGRRHIVSAWNVSDLNDMALPPCHALFQFYVSSDKKLSCQLYQRSADFFLGVPFNIASYALLTHLVAHVCNLEVGDFIHTFGDAHIYLNHLAQVEEQLSRDVLPLPTLKINKTIKNIFDFKMEDIELVGYKSHSKIHADMAV